MNGHLVPLTRSKIKWRAPVLPTAIEYPMKNAFLVSSLIIAAGYFIAVAASTTGVISFRLPSFSAVVGAYAAIGVLTFAFRDYASQPGANARPATRRSPRAEARPAAYAVSLTSRTLHAN